MCRHQRSHKTLCFKAFRRCAENKCVFGNAHGILRGLGRRKNCGVHWHLRFRTEDVQICPQLGCRDRLRTYASG